MALSAFELRRKILHILIGLAIIFSVIYIQGIKWILFGILIAGMIISVASLNFRIPIISWMLDLFERKHYRKTFPGRGPLFLLAGSLLVLKLFHSDIALASIAIATFSDPFFSFDKRVFKGMIKFKNVRSIFLGLAAGTIAASFFISPFNALIASIFGAFIESLAIFLGSDPVDDNIIIPISAGTVLYLMAMFF